MMHELNILQDKLLDMLAFFHDYCISNNLVYYTLGGTTLGAIRHQGFIPWDDDVDVGMPRKDYEKLLKIFPQNNQKYIIESTNSKDQHFCYSFAKLYNTETTLIENVKNPIKRGIYIDIFPLDGAGNTEEEAKKAYAPIARRKILLNLRTIKINSNRAFHKNVLLKMVQIIPNSIINEKKLCQKIDKLSKRYDYDSSTIVGNYSGAWGIKEIMSKSYFGTPTLHKFETIEVFVQENYDAYLTHQYGDWRKLPPKEKQVSHHDYQ